MPCIKRWKLLKKISRMCSIWRRASGNKPVGSAEASLPSYDVDISMLSDTGCQRDVNEDYLQYVKPSDADLVARKGVLGMVADGMGGHAAGEVASKLAADVISRLYYRHDGEPALALQQAFEEANHVIYKTARQNRHLQGMGTTCTALVLRHDMAYVAHVGDSRLYLLRDGVLRLMTEDHSFVRQMVKAGLITAEEARSHPAKHVITRALGAGPIIEVAVGKAPWPVREGDLFILCSDGLYDLVGEAELQHILLAQPTAAGCERLIALARERGGYDNISVGLLRITLAGRQTGQDTPDTRRMPAPGNRS